MTAIPPETVSAGLMERCDTAYKAAEGRHGRRRGLLAAVQVAYASGKRDGAAAERARIRQLAQDHHALCDCYEDDCELSMAGHPHKQPFADLLGEPST